MKKRSKQSETSGVGVIVICLV